MPTLHSVKLNIFVYTGTQNTYTESDLKYTLEKERLSTHDYVIFEIAELVRDYIDVTFNNDYTSTAKWVTTEAEKYEEGEDSPYETTTTHFLAMDGFGYFEDGINPQLSDNALISANTLYLPEGTSGKLPILAEGVGKVSIDAVDTQITDNGNTNQKIQYITIPADSDEVKVYDTDDTTLLKTITVNNICEPKFTEYKATFVNKHGAYQDVWFFKKTIENMTITDEIFKSNTIDTNTLTYGINKGQQQRYNVQANKSLTINTGFVNEDFNKTIEEMLLSENVWLRINNQTVPVLCKSMNMNYKTSVNDKLINHTIEFEFAFNKINNVR
jgi:hypothetical protein